MQFFHVEWKLVFRVEIVVYTKTKLKYILVRIGDDENVESSPVGVRICVMVQLQENVIKDGQLQTCRGCTQTSLLNSLQNLLFVPSQVDALWGRWNCC